MALIQCYECGRNGVSDTARRCPGCGYDIAAETRRRVDEQNEEIFRRIAACIEEGRCPKCGGETKRSYKSALDGGYPLDRCKSCTWHTY
ncbi:MAG: hypothetical protein LBD23_10425 [Oscillospiraceae bacterium]|nr:hypothetical protein [Oscillospiraceae bacterium]